MDALSEQFHEMAELRARLQDVMDVTSDYGHLETLKEIDECLEIVDLLVDSGIALHAQIKKSTSIGANLAPI